MAVITLVVIGLTTLIVVVFSANPLVTAPMLRARLGAGERGEDHQGATGLTAVPLGVNR